MTAEKIDDFARVRDMLVHPHMQRLDPLQDIERVGGAQRGAEIAQTFRPGPHDEGGGAEFLGEIETVIAVIGFRQGRKLSRFFPVEIARIDHHPANRRAVTAKELGCRMHHDIDAIFERAAQIRGGKGVVDHQGET